MRNWPLWMLMLPAGGMAAVPFVVGACTHFGQGKGVLQQNLSMLRQSCISSFRDEIGWRAVEKTKGQYAVSPAYDAFIDQGRKQGMEPLLILDYGNPLYDQGDKPRSAEAVEAFTKYAEFMVRHFKDRVKLWEVWNEWDIAIGSKTPGSADDYATLLNAVYPRIKAVDPTITVFGGAPTPGGVKNGWLERILEKDALHSMDVLSIHTYNYSEPGKAREPEAWAQWMTQVETLARKYSGGQQVSIYVTEMGWPTQTGKPGTPPEVSAAYLVRLYLLARTMPFLKGIWWYDFQDDGWKAAYNENNFGIVRPDLAPKPSWFAMRGIAGLAARGEYLGRVQTGDPEVWALRFREGSGQTWALWSTHAGDYWQIAISASPFTLRQAGTEGIARTASKDPFELVLAGMPWLITGDLAGATVSDVEHRE